MSGWGPWAERDDVGRIISVHVVPCDQSLCVINGHTQSESCYCRPRRDDREPSMFIHNDPERGGLDS